MDKIEKKPKLSKFVWTLVISFVLLLLMLVLSILYGDAHIQLSTIYDAIFHYNPSNEKHNIISEIRIPRDLGAILVGMALAVSGAVVQGVTKNGLADPSLIGLNAGASFMLALTYALKPDAHFSLLMIAGFIGAIIGGTLVLIMGRSRTDGFNPIRIILAGAAISAFLTALSQGIALAFKLNQDINFWSMGGVSGTTWVQLKYSAPIIIIAIVLIILLSRQLTILNLGESLAKGLGQNVTVIRTISLVLTMLLAGIAVAMVGQIAFVGLIVPHIVRFIIGTDYAKVIPITALLGGFLVLLADTVARMLGDAPVGAIVSFIGVPYFIYLIRKGGRTI